MEFEYYFGETNVSFGESYTYDADYEELKRAFINIQLDWLSYELDRKLTPEEREIARKTLVIVAENNDDVVYNFCKQYYDDVKDYLEKYAYEEWRY